MTFYRHDESCEARNKGNSLELLELLSHNFDEIRSVILKNAQSQANTPHIQKDTVWACALEINDAIIKELGDSTFAISINESHDISTYVDRGVK